MKEYALTYTQGRKCLHCEAPIADHIHQGRKFCEREVLPYGSVKSCHDDYNARLRKERGTPFREQTAFQKKLSMAITALYQAKGEDVTVDDLDRYDIPLEWALRREDKGGRWFNFFFIHHRIEQFSLTRFKIYPYVHSL